MPVYKDKNNGSYFYSVRYKDTFGTNKRKVKRGFKRRKDAKMAESEFIQKVKYGYTDNQTFESIFFDRLKSSNLSERTVEKRIIEYNKYIKHMFGTIPIGKITTVQCLEFRNSLANNKNLSPAFTRSIYAGFKAVLNYAIKHYKLMYDPSLPIEPLPRTKTKATYILRQDFDEQVKLIKPEVFRQLSNLLFYSGLRIGEALALQWSDYDFNSGELNIYKKVNLQNRKIDFKLKRESSEGVIPVPQNIQDMLRDMYNKDKNKYKYFDNDYFIFGGYEILSYHTYVSHFKKAFPNNRIHDLRHSYATFLINKGIDIYLLMKLMRHSNISETINTYSHLYTDRKKEAMKLFN